MSDYDAATAVAEEEKAIESVEARVGRIRYGYYEDPEGEFTEEDVVYYLENLEKDDDIHIEREMLRILSKFMIVPDWSELITTDVKETV